LPVRRYSWRKSLAARIDEGIGFKMSPLHVGSNAKKGDAKDPNTVEKFFLPIAGRNSGEILEEFMTVEAHHFYAFGPFRWDADKRILVRDGQPISLAPKAAELLFVLIANAGRLVDKEDLIKQVWPDAFVEEGNLNKNISILRKVLGDWESGREYIETVPKRGYRFVAPVNEVTHAEGASKPQTFGCGASLFAKKVSHYLVLELLGGGGMGVVYEAEDLRLGRRVALKFLPQELGDDAKALERFEHEARAASTLDHPNICAVYEFGEHEGQPFIVMPLLEGQTLREQIATRRAPFAVGELVGLAIQIASALEAAHEKGIIHRDIKPTNIFVAGRGHAKILDFGLAKVTPVLNAGAAQATVTPEERLSGPRTALGTVAYMSPEQVRGQELDVRTDLFSFGVVLYEMATGRLPFQGDTSGIVFDAILNSDPVRPSSVNREIPSDLDVIIYKALEKDRELRYQHVSELLTDLKRVKRNADSATAGIQTELKRLNLQMDWLAKPITITLVDLAGILLTAAALVATLIAYPQLPQSVPTQWGINNQPNGYSPKWTLFFIGPGLMAGTMIFFHILPWLSPKNWRLDRFRTTCLRIMLVKVSILAYVYGVCLWAGTSHSVNAGRVIVGGVCLLVALWAGLLGKIRRNFFVGVLTPWTLANEQVWNKTHRLAAKTFAAAGITGLVLTAIGLDGWLIFATLMAGFLVPIAYSLIYYKQFERRGEL
jgi:serine/threonine protein kinase